MHKGHVNVPVYNENTRKGTNLEFCGSHPTVKKLVPEAEDKPYCGSHSTNGDGSLSSGIDSENDVGREAEYGSVQPADGR